MYLSLKRSHRISKISEEVEKKLLHDFTRGILQFQKDNISYAVMRQNTLQRSDSSRELNSDDFPTFVQPETNKFNQSLTRIHTA